MYEEWPVVAGKGRNNIKKLLKKKDIDSWLTSPTWPQPATASVPSNRLASLIPVARLRNRRNRYAVATALSCGFSENGRGMVGGSR